MPRQFLWRLLPGKEKRIIRAAEHGHLDQIRACLEAGADPNAKSGDGFTVLTWAAARGHIEAVKLLLEAGAELNVQTRKGPTAQDIATQEGRHDIAAMLREAGGRP